MINILLGVSGSGKSYEANVFHILVALGKGRLVITNLPVVVEAYAAIDPSYRDLIVLRTKPQAVRGNWRPTREEGAFEVVEGMNETPPPEQRVFGGVWDYFDTWRHPVHGFGPLYVIDEAQYALPVRETVRDVEEWFALHRHFNADVLLITQSYGKLSRAVIDNVQMVYRCRKNIALGAPSSYTRKVQDGVRGEVVNTAIRRYEAKYFKLYRSHTQGGAVEEFNASDVRPLWKHWSFIGAAICLLIVVGMLVFGKTKVNPIGAFTEKPGEKKRLVKLGDPARSTPAALAASAPVRVALAASAPASAPTVIEPYGGKSLHLVGHMQKADGSEAWSFVLAQNGIGVAVLNGDELKAAGYTWKPLHQCAGELRYASTVRFVICDAPQVQYGMPGLQTAQARGGAPARGEVPRGEAVGGAISLGGDPGPVRAPKAASKGA